MIEQIVGAVIIALLLCVPVVGYVLERKAWNNGKCRKCGHDLIQFDMDSQGGRLYKCINPSGAHYGPDISYPWVDSHRAAEH